MSLEIERRFLVKGDDWKNFVQSSENLTQGYLITNEEEWTIRVRVVNEKESLLTLKHPKNGIIRYEFEYMIPIDDGISILKKSHFKINKTRYELKLNSDIWIVDSFKENNFPLVIAEIELNDVDQKINIPEWCYLEVSHLNEFSNAALAKSPISTWPIEKRPSIL